MTGKVTVRQTTFQTGTTKIAVPITGRTTKEIIIQAKNALAHHPDVIEWRIDYYADVLNIDDYLVTYHQLREALGDTVLLTTFRTTGEGGEADLDDAGYTALYKRLIDNQLTDMLDVELHFSEAAISNLIYLAHQHGIKVILSAHEFQGTPPELEITNLLERMQNQNADIAKIAAMPTKFKDVLTMMRATASESEKMAIPIIAISMGGLGKISRITAPLFGSVVSFATVGDASAPGQIAIDDLRKEMKTFETK
ncbi:type I 3-dehydroquinate dehydratase [Lentilactobacillus otakiensis]|uniref:type I 3-dehydroquinate dehydratase n=1 Tax=Lentilactobacillus otakiensis TaxID=481720 RepID=UPI003D1758F9